jgi:hypothetical protein
MPKELLSEEWITEYAALWNVEPTIRDTGFPADRHGRKLAEIRHRGSSDPKGADLPKDQV